MTKQKKKFLVSGWVQLSVWAEIEATSLKEAQKIIDKSHGSGSPNDFDWQDGVWSSPVTVESIEEETSK